MFNIEYDNKIYLEFSYLSITLIFDKNCDIDSRFVKNEELEKSVTFT